LRSTGYAPSKTQKLTKNQPVFANGRDPEQALSIMLRYFLRRLLIALPTLLIVSLAVFGISKCAPGDPVETLFTEELRTATEPGQEAEQYKRAARQLGLDKPVFYFTLAPAPFPDTFWGVYPSERRERLSKLVFQTGNWPDVSLYDSSLSAFSKTALSSATPPTHEGISHWNCRC
jgi:peptide/nickel transport system permease protein